MPAGSHVGTDTVGHSPTASIVHLLGELAETRSGADGGFPSDIVHGKLLKVYHVDGDSSVRTTEAWTG